MVVQNLKLSLKRHASGKKNKEGNIWMKARVMFKTVTSLLDKRGSSFAIDLYGVV